MIATCARCGEQVRWGFRPTPRQPQPSREGAGYWMRRDPDADHQPVLGDPETPEMFERREWLRLHHQWEAADGELTTAAEHDRAKMSKAAREAADVEEEIEPVSLPEPEVRAVPIDIGDPRLPQGAKNKINLGRKNGWTAEATYSRGPRTHATHGTLLGISDYVVVRLRLDGSDRRAVACWQDGKLLFAYALVADLDRRVYTTRSVNDGQLKSWLKQEESA